nr:chromate transporter [Flavonifractor plautii]
MFPRGAGGGRRRGRTVHPGGEGRAAAVIYLQLFFEFFKAGLFAIGGGLATIPFLTDIGQRTGWFTSGELANMIAISESTPGPMGVNMATYVGFHTGGIAGGVIATLGLVCPSILVILVIAGFLKKFRESQGVDAVFYGIRPASTALIAAALAEVCSIALLNLSAFQTGGAAALFQWKGIALAVVIFVCLQVKPLKKLHPIVFIAASAVIGAVFQF